MEINDAKPNTAILWDIENVTPPAGSGYIQSIIDTISERGKMSYAMAFGDWNRNHIKNIAGELAVNSFELIHVPSARKDSSDMSMVAHGVELIFQYPHIASYVLITGDADFRPLLLSLRKYGKKTLIICDVKNNASEDLLNMADEYLDYREIIDTEGDANDDEETDSAEVISRPQAYQLLEEAVEIMVQEKKRPAIGAAKVKMKLLNSNFDEHKLGYRSWMAFVKDAVRKTAVRFDSEDDKLLRLEHSSKGSSKIIPEIFILLLDSLPQNADTWAKFDETSKILSRKVDLKKSGYSQFKKLALDAEKRGLVSIKNNLFTWYIKKC